MSSTNLSKERLDKAIRARDALNEQIRSLQSKRDRALGELAAVETECRSKGIDPDKLPELIKRAEERLESLLSDVEGKLAEASSKLSGYTNI